MNRIHHNPTLGLTLTEDIKEKILKGDYPTNEIKGDWYIEVKNIGAGAIILAVGFMGENGIKVGELGYNVLHTGDTLTLSCDKKTVLTIK